MTKEVFDTLGPKEQLQEVRDYPIKTFVIDGYTPCATRHNGLVDWYIEKFEQGNDK